MRNFSNILSTLINSANRYILVRVSENESFVCQHEVCNMIELVFENYIFEYRFLL